MDKSAGGPHLHLWLPALIFGHVFALFWLVRAYLLAYAQRYIRKRRGVSLKQGAAAPSSEAGSAAAPSAPSSESSSCGVSSIDVEACCTLSDLKHPPVVSRDDDHTGRDDQAAAGRKAPHKIRAVHGLLQPLSKRDAAKDQHVLTVPSVQQQELDAEPLAVEWQALGCSYDISGQKKVVLQDVWGKAEPGQMQALMGPSGAGKSTLMDMLAMRKSVGNLTGQLLVNGQPASASFIRQSSYVPQENTFIPTMTSQETLMFYAGVTLGENWPHSKRKERVAAVLAAVGLAESAHTPVGGALPGGLNLRGLSGGETRRLSIAAGILAHPSVLFLDEPTSGLDSFAALSVMGYLQHFAQATQQTVIVTIHQPRSAIWEMFDTVSLLASGRLMYHGRCAEMVPWFNTLGYQYVRGAESDWVLDLVATGFDKPSHLFGHTLRTAADVHAAADAFKEHYVAECHLLPPATNDSNDSTTAGSKAGSVISAGSSSGSPRRLSSRFIKGKNSALWQSPSSMSYPTGWWRQFAALLKRELAGMTRNPFDVAARVLTFTYVALLFGLMGYRIVFQGAEGLRSRNNILFLTNVVTMLFPYICISLYTADKRIYLADTSAKRYRPSAYYAAKVLATLPFSLVSTIVYSGVLYGLSGLRAGGIYFAKYTCIVTLFYLIACQVLHLCTVVAPNQDATFSLSIMWSAVQLLCSSYIINFSQPYNQWLTQLRYIDALYFALEALMQNELKGSTADCSDGLNNDQVDLLTAGVSNMTAMQRAVLNQLKQPQPGCVFQEEVLLEPMGFNRPFGVSVSILVGYLGVVHVLTFLGLVLAARRERR